MKKEKKKERERKKEGQKKKVTIIYISRKSFEP